MAIKIVTDSGSDLPKKIINDLGITVVPLYIYFEDKGYRDGVDLSADELYTRLADGVVHPTTTQPMPNDFANVYRELSHETNQIVSIHLSKKVSGTYNSALQGKEILHNICNIKIIDSFAISMGLGLVVIAAARMAQAGGTVQEVVNETNKAIGQIRLLGVLDSLKYLLAGGRITRARATVGSLLKVKPVLTLHDGEIVQAGLARSYPKGIDQLYEFVRKTTSIQEVAIVQSTVPNEAGLLKERISGIVDKDLIHEARLGAALGVHGGPGTLIVAVRQA